MFRTTVLAALLGAATVLPAFADQPMIKSIEVETSLDDIQNPQAAAYWKDLDSDLEAAIASQLVGRLGEEGMEIKIDMNEIELANFFQEQIGAAETEMSGKVHVIDMNDNSNFKTFDLTVKVQQIMPMLPPDTEVRLVVPTEDEVYAKMVAAFARNVVERIDT